MKQSMVFSLIAALFLSTHGAAQTAVTTPTSETANTIPKFTGSAILGPSAVSEQNGLVGIGQPSPAAPLTLTGNLVIGVNYQGDASLQIYGPQGNAYVTDFSSQIPDGTALNIMMSLYNGAVGYYWNWGISQNQWSINPSNFFGNQGVRGINYPFTITNAGYVGMGTPSPGGALEVHGGTMLLSAANSSITFPDGSVQRTAWNNTTLGGDYAESIDVDGDRADYEPGDVIVIDSASAGRFVKSDKAYSKLVVGVFSTKPGLVGRRVTIDRPNQNAEVPMAMLGIVPVKVSDENGPIATGDLLVSASRPGYAMKGTDGRLLKGAVLGKALAPFPSGAGVIEALISLP